MRAAISLSPSASSAVADRALPAYRDGVGNGFDPSLWFCAELPTFDIGKLIMGFRDHFHLWSGSGFLLRYVTRIRP